MKLRRGKYPKRSGNQSAVEGSRRDPRPSTRRFSEDWSRQKFYRTMLHVFISRGKGEPEDYAPFFQQSKTRRLTQAQFEASRDLYVENQSREYRARGVRGESATKGPAGIRWPDPLPGEPPQTPTKAQIALGRLLLARTKAEQAKARDGVRALASQGSLLRRKALKLARAATPQAKAVHSVETLFKIVSYRAARQFLWHFLNREMLAAVRRRGRAMSHFLADPSAFEAEVDGLVKAYPFIDLTRDQILEGFRERSPADLDTAERFGLSTSVRSLLSANFGPR